MTTTTAQWTIEVRDTKPTEDGSARGEIRPIVVAVDIDPRDFTVTVDTRSRQPGQAVPSDIYHGIVQRVWLDCYPVAEQFAAWLNTPDGQDAISLATDVETGGEYATNALQEGAAACDQIAWFTVEDWLYEDSRDGLGELVADMTETEIANRARHIEESAWTDYAGPDYRHVVLIGDVRAYLLELAAEYAGQDE